MSHTTGTRPGRHAAGGRMSAGTDGTTMETLLCEVLLIADARCLQACHGPVSKRNAAALRAFNVMSRVKSPFIHGRGVVGGYHVVIGIYHLKRE